MASKSQRKTATPVKSKTSKRVENSWILLLKDSLFQNDNFSIVTLPHPAHEKPAKYVLDNLHHKMYEVVTFSESNRSWFIGETVKSDGALMMMTPINPIFLVLPRLKKQCTSRAIPLEDLLSEKGFDKILEYIPSLDIVADLKGSADMKAYKYNEEKALNWLENRVRKLAKVLKEQNIHVTAGAVSSTFVASNVSSESIDEEFYLKYAHGMVSEYLQIDLAELLEKMFDFKPDLIETVGKKKRKSSAEESNSITKKIKCEGEEDIKENMLHNSFEKSVEVKKLKPLTAKEKARQKAASGTKTISAFFTKK